MSTVARHPEGGAEAHGKRRTSSGLGIKLPDLDKRLDFLFAAIPPLAAIVLALVYLKIERWQESLQWGLIGLGLGLRALPDEALPFGARLKPLALVCLAAGAALFGYWVYEEWHG